MLKFKNGLKIKHYDVVIRFIPSELIHTSDIMVWSA